MQAFDAGQERELAFQRSQNAWTRLGMARRIVAGLFIPLVLGSAAGGFAALAGGPWLLIACLAALTIGLVLLPHVVMPERMLRASVRMTTPTAESMKRGDNNASWPG